MAGAKPRGLFWEIAWFTVAATTICTHLQVGKRGPCTGIDVMENLHVSETSALACYGFWNQRQL